MGVRLQVNIATGNAAFVDMPEAATVEALRKIADDIEGGALTGNPIYDENGNKVGSWEFSDTWEA